MNLLCHGGGLGRGLCTWLSRSLVWGKGCPCSVLPLQAQSPHELVSLGRGVTEDFQEQFSLPPPPHMPTSAFSPILFSPPALHPYLPRCCSQSPRANLVPVLTLSLSSAVAGVVCSSVDMGKARGRALPSSSSIALHNDNCLSCACGLAHFHMHQVI